MILVDSSVWIDHLRATDRLLFSELDAGHILGHPFVIGKVALGNLQPRSETLALMQRLPQAPTANHAEVMYLIEQHHLYGRGIGWLDAHLLASTLLTDDAQLWTRDKRLRGVADGLGLTNGTYH